MNLPLLSMWGVVALALCQRPAFDARLLARTTDSMEIALVREGSRQAVGELWDELKDTTIHGVPALRRVYRTVNHVFGPHAETTFVRLADLTLISRRTHSQTTSDSLVVTGDSVLGWRQTEQGTHAPVRRARDPQVIEASFFDALIRAAPLSPEYAIEVRGFIGPTDSIATLRARVIGTAAIQQRNGASTETWQVDMDFAGLSSTLWIDKKTRALVRQVIRLAPSIQMLMRR
jgi:hypothetical protein